MAPCKKHCTSGISVGSTREIRRISSSDSKGNSHFSRDRLCCREVHLSHCEVRIESHDRWRYPHRTRALAAQGSVIDSTNLWCRDGLYNPWPRFPRVSHDHGNLREATVDRRWRICLTCISWSDTSVSLEREKGGSITNYARSSRNLQLKRNPSVIDAAATKKTNRISLRIASTRLDVFNCDMDERIYRWVSLFNDYSLGLCVYRR